MLSSFFVRKYRSQTKTVAGANTNMLPVSRRIPICNPLYIIFLCSTHAKPSHSGTADSVMPSLFNGFFSFIARHLRGGSTLLVAENIQVMRKIEVLDAF